jgi:hypothetical protein
MIEVSRKNRGRTTTRGGLVNRAESYGAPVS